MSASNFAVSMPAPTVDPTSAVVDDGPRTPYERRRTGSDGESRKRRRLLPPDRGFALLLVVADIAIVASTTIAANLAGGTGFVAPNGRPGDVVGISATVAIALLLNWALGLYRRPPAGVALSWIAPVAVAGTATVVMAAASEVVVGRLLVSRTALVALMFVAPGLVAGARCIAQLGFSRAHPDAATASSLSSLSSFDTSAPWLAELGSRGGSATPEFVAVRARPSVYLVHRIDQWSVLAVALWALPLGAILAVVQKMRGRHLVGLAAPNGTSVHVFDVSSRSIVRRLGFDLVPALWPVFRGQVSLLAPTWSAAELSVTRAVRRWPFVISWLLTLRLFGLGHATGDTWDHILQITGVWEWSDWHPVFDAFIFWPSYELFGSPILVTAALIGSFWAALYIASRSVERASGRNLTLIAVAIGFNPILFNYMGLLAKDAFAAAVVVLGVALLMRERVMSGRRGLTLVVAGIAVFAAALFTPAVIAITTTLLIYVWARALRRLSVPSLLRLTVAGVLGFATAGATVIVERQAEQAVGAFESHKEESIMLFDLTGMSDELDENLLPDGFLSADRVDEFVNDCYDPKEWDSVAPFGGRCNWVLSTPEAQGVWGEGELGPVWSAAIRDHPGEYLQHRTRHLGAFLVSSGKSPTYYPVEILDFEGNWKLEHNAVMDAYLTFYQRFARVFFRPIIWLTGLVALFIGFLRRRSTSAWGSLPLATCAAGIGFYLSLGLIGAAYDFRYNYSAIWLFFFGVLMFLSDSLATQNHAADVTTVKVDR